MQKYKMICPRRKVIRETKDAVTITFDISESGFNYLPGQFINVSMVINGEKITRSYSLSSSPDLDPYPAITVKRVTDGLMSNYLVDYAEQIPELEIEGPYGAFVPSESSYQSGHIVLLSGGSGITPLLSIAKSLLSKSAGVQLTLIYANRNWSDAIFTAAIETLALEYKDRLTVFHALSRQEGPKPSFTGTLIEDRLSKLLVKKLLKQVTAGKQSGTHYFICGPSGLMKVYHDVLKSLQVSETDIFIERFTAEDEILEKLSLPQITREVLVHFYEQTHLIEIPPATSLLSAALKEGISFGHSCKSGTCGSCVALLTSGKVSMLKNYALTENEVAQGMILLCQSYPLSEDITIEFD